MTSRSPKLGVTRTSGHCIVACHHGKVGGNPESPPDTCRVSRSAGVPWPITLQPHDHDPEDSDLRPGKKRTGSDPQTLRDRAHDSELERLWSYHRLLRAANSRLNLTRIHKFENMVLKHYVDSLLVLRFVDLPSPLIDMGSGPGLAGNPPDNCAPGNRDDPGRAAR